MTALYYSFLAVIKINEPYQKDLNDYGKGHSFDKQRALFMCLWHTTLVQTRVCKQMEYAIFLLINVWMESNYVLNFHRSTK